MTKLAEVFLSSGDLLRLEPEELAGVLLEVIPTVAQQGHFIWQQIIEQVFPPSGSGWPRGDFDSVKLAVAEALNWLQTQGLIMREPDQPGDWMRLTRRGRSLTTRADVEAYKRSGTLPAQLLQPHLAEKVHHLFVRGDHDIAVFQAFKEVEVAVRMACKFPDDVVGRALMARAFGATDGPLRDPDLIEAEREAEFFMFSGAIGHAKNPTSHRTVGLSRHEAARLIVFASHLLAIVEERQANA